MIKNAKNISLSSDSNTLPNMEEGMKGWFQKITIKLITKTVVDFQNKEEEKSVTFSGVVQPLSPRSIEMKPEGQRKWRWLQIHADITLVMDIDDIVRYDNVKFRVKARGEYNHFGYYRYELMEDYENAS